MKEKSTDEIFAMKVMKKEHILQQADVSSEKRNVLHQHTGV